MSDGKRRRFRKNKVEEKRPVILAKRETVASSSAKAELELQPKILLKSKDDARASAGGSSTSPHSEMLQLPHQKTIIVTRSEVVHSPALSPNTTRAELSASSAVDATAQQPQQLLLQQPTPSLVEPVPQMTRPATVISSTGFINASVRKLLLKTNCDFLVVGVVGTQGVGKSTIMNLLVNEQHDTDYYRKVFVEEDSIFPTKPKLHKCSVRSRTESTHMFITKDRLILLDTPPVLCNSYKKDMTTNELDDIRNIISLLTVCHLLIVVQDDYFNMNFMRLLQFAELMKPAQEAKQPAAIVNDYFPNLLFVKNRAKRQDFMPGQKQRIDAMLKCFFRDSQLRVFLGQTAAEQPPTGATATQQQQQRLRKARTLESERVINSILLPEVQSNASTSFHLPLNDIIEELRNVVFMTPRNALYAGGSTTELNESIWFELLTKVSADNQHFFFNTYEEIQRQHLDVGNNSGSTAGGGGGGGGNGKDSHDLWIDK